jgi:hypothetical protein
LDFAICFLAEPALVVWFAVLCTLLVVEVNKSRARWLNMLCLKSRFDYVEWVCDGASNASGNSCAQEIPKEWVLTLPRLKTSFKVFITANDCHRER